MKFLGDALSPYSSIPNSTLFIIGVAGALAVMSTTANRLLVDVKKIRLVTKEVNAWRQEMEKAKKSGDKRLLAKVTKKQQAMMKLQSSMMWDRMKVSFIFLAPFWIIFMILNRFYSNVVVALSPFTIPLLLAGSIDSNLGAIQMPFFSWYIICSFSISLPLSRLLGVNPED